MIPTQNFIEYPEFGDNSTKIKPDGAKYAAGFQPAEVLPAEYLNWFLAGATQGVTDLNTGLSSVEAELNAILTAAGEIPNNTSGQVLSAIQYVIQTKTGVITNLNTTAKANIVAAVNEILATLTAHMNNTSNPHQVKGSQLTEPVPTEKIADSAVTAPKLANSSVSEFSKLSNSMQNLLFPAGKVEYLSFVPTAEWLTANRRIVCDGSAINRSEYPRLFNAIGTTHGVGDGTTTFNLPNYVGRMLYGSSTSVTTKGGRESVTLTTSNLPSHSHTMSHTHSINHSHTVSNYWRRTGANAAPSLNDNLKSTNNGVYSQTSLSYSGDSGASSASNTGSSGSGTAVNVMNPYCTAVPVITY